MPRPKEKYTYTVADIAHITSQPQNTVRQHIARGRVNPDNLSSVLDYCWTFKKHKVDNTGYMSLIEDEACKPIEQPSEEKGK